MAITDKDKDISAWIKYVKESNSYTFEETYYLGIKKDWSVTSLENSTACFADAKYGVVILLYKEIYLNLPTFINEDYFTLFVTENGVSETLVENGWTLSMEKSKSVRCQSDIKCYKIFKDNLCLDLSFINAHLTIPLVLRDCLETFNKAQRCTTQYDLDNLKKDYEYNKEFNLWKQLYEKNEEIKELNKRILNAETDLHHKEQAIEDYKDLLIQIKDLIEQK